MTPGWGVLLQTVSLCLEHVASTRRPIGRIPSTPLHPTFTVNQPIGQRERCLLHRAWLARRRRGRKKEEEREGEERQEERNGEKEEGEERKKKK